MLFSFYELKTSTKFCRFLTQRGLCVCGLGKWFLWCCWHVSRYPRRVHVHRTAVLGRGVAFTATRPHLTSWIFTTGLDGACQGPVVSSAQWAAACNDNGRISQLWYVDKFSLLVSASCELCCDVVRYMAVGICVVHHYYNYYYAAFNAPCVGHKDDESQARAVNS